VFHISVTLTLIMLSTALTDWSF